jgi:hypothetical protein
MTTRNTIHVRDPRGHIHIRYRYFFERIYQPIDQDELLKRIAALEQENRRLDNIAGDFNQALSDMENKLIAAEDRIRELEQALRDIQAQAAGHELKHYGWYRGKSIVLTEDNLKYIGKLLAREDKPE